MTDWAGTVGLLGSCSQALYTLGALVNTTKRWNPHPGGLIFPKHWGFHEVWPLFVLGGTGAHVATMLSLR